MSMLPGKHQTAFASMSKLKPYLQEEIRKHKEERDPSNPRDYIDCYLEEIEKVLVSQDALVYLYSFKRPLLVVGTCVNTSFVNNHVCPTEKDAFCLIMVKLQHLYVGAKWNITTEP